MSQENKQALLLKNRANKQWRTGQSSNSPIQSAIATSSILTNSETSPPMTNNRSTTSYEATEPSRNQASARTPLSVRFDGASAIDPNRGSRSSHGTIVFFVSIIKTSVGLIKIKICTISKFILSWISLQVYKHAVRGSTAEPRTNHRC